MKGRRTMKAAALLAAILVTVAPSVAQEAEAGKGNLAVTLERLGSFYYAGDPVRIRVGVFNTGETPYDNAAGMDLLGSIIIGDRTGAADLKKNPSPVSSSRFQPGVIPPGGFFGFIADLRDVIPDLEKPGRYTARVKLPALESDSISIIVIPRFDPASRYRATMETDYGTMTFDLLGAAAPKHVQNFFNLANQGYYDDSYVRAVIKGIHFLAGDTAGDGTGSPGYDLPLEISAGQKLGRGTLAMARREGTDHGSQFIISFGENSPFEGALSIFGVLADGEEAMAAIENLPTTGQDQQPFYKPIRETRIRSIRVAPAPEGSKATAQ